MDSLALEIKKTALQMGYEKCGIIKIEAMAGYEEKLDERIACIPETKAFYERFYHFAHLQETYPWAKSIVVCVNQYGKYHVPENLQGLIGKAYLFDSRKDEQSKELQESLRFEKYLEGAGIKTATERKFGITAMRWAALQTGLGVVRRNNFFYTESGSWVFLEAWLIDKELELIEKPMAKECPAQCNRCVNSCPTASLVQPYAMKPTTCISFLTTFGGRDLPKEDCNEQMGNWIYGCDVCQDICPMNKNRWTGTEDFPGLEELSQHISLEKIMTMEYSFLEEVIQRKFWYVPKEEVWKWRVNAINAMVNDYKAEYKEYILGACKDGHEKVREMAHWATDKMNF